MELTTFVRLRQWARAIRQDGHAIYLAARDPRLPWHVRVAAVCVAAYALSPIDLIPDFVPVLGYLDDMVIVPLGILLVVRMIPDEILAEHRAAAAATRPRSAAGAGAIAALWVALAVTAGWLISRYL